MYTNNASNNKAKKMQKRYTKKLKRTLFLGAGLLQGLVVFAQQLPYQNPALPSAVRAKDLVSRLTLKEKVSLMKDVSDAIPRLGIKKFNWWSEACF
jgi:beta-glucosidase